VERLYQFAGTVFRKRFFEEVLGEGREARDIEQHAPEVVEELLIREVVLQRRSRFPGGDIVFDDGLEMPHRVVAGEPQRIAQRFEIGLHLGERLQRFLGRGTVDDRALHSLTVGGREIGLRAGEDRLQIAVVRWHDRDRLVRGGFEAAAPADTVLREKRKGGGAGTLDGHYERFRSRGRV